MAENQKRGVKRMRTETGIVSKKSALPQGEMYEKWKKRTHKEIGGNDPDAGPSRAGPNMKVNSKVRDEIRSASEIRAIKEGKDNMKLKNMKKDKRGKIEAASRKKRKANSETYGNKKVQYAGMSKRSKLIVRM